jgi:hypothetical protein
LAFSTTASNGFIGNLDEFALINVLAAPSPGSVYVPELLYAQFQSQFAAVAIGILLGCVAERARIFPTIVFTFVWVTLVYCPMVLCLKIFANIRHAGFGIQQDGHSNGESSTLPAEDPSKSQAALERSHTQSSSDLERVLAREESSNRIDHIVSRMSCLELSSSGLDGLDLTLDRLLARIFVLSWHSWSQISRDAPVQ